MSTRVACDHCLLQFNERDAVHDRINGQEKAFCCSGCRGVYRVIHAEGLDEFYRKRTGWRAGPPESAEISSEVFEKSVRTEEGVAEIDLAVSGIRCASCIWLIEHFIRRLNGILDIRLNYATHRAHIRWRPEIIDLKTILIRMQSLGYIPRPQTVTDLEEHLRGEKRDLLVRFGTASFLTMQLMLFTTALYAGYFQGIEPIYKRIFEIIAFLISTPVMFYCGHPFLKNTWQGLRNRTFTMDTLIVLGSFSAYFFSIAMMLTGGEVYFDTSAGIITLILLGRYLETGARDKTTRTLSSLITLQPDTARLVGEGADGRQPLSTTVPVSSLAVGDIIEIIPGDRIPIDGTVTDGRSEVDESMLTGESKPVQKEKGLGVFGGTVNLNGRLLCRVRATGKETALAQIIRTVEDSLSRKPQLQTYAEKTVRWFVPSILVIAGLTFLFWFVRGVALAPSLMHSIAVLVIACPCALGLATPLAVLIGTSLMYTRGILVKGGDVIEAIADITTVSFDKTGTLTAGRPTLKQIRSYGIDDDSLRIFAASLERSSEHTIARALRQGVRETDLIPVKDFEAVPGMGVKGILAGKRVLVGNLGLLRSNAVPVSPQAMKDYTDLSLGSNTVVGLAADESLKGWFVISDNLRPEVPEVIEQLHRSGFQTHLITGDNPVAAGEIGRSAGIGRIDAEVLPGSKAERIRQIRAEGRKVMMVGDGINDAPALVEADVGVAMGSGTDIALESADAVLMRSDLRLIPSLIMISRRTRKVIKENLFWAFSYNLIAIPLAVSGMIHPVISALLMAVSSLLVVGNSLRLYRVR